MQSLNFFNYSKTLDFPKIVDDCYKKEWVVYCKPPFKTAACVVEYLGRYTHRVAISNNRILSIKNGFVTFKWRDYKALSNNASDGLKQKVMSISAEEFIRRFLMHILPQGFMKIRHYGFLGNRNKLSKLKLCKIQTHTPVFPIEKFSAVQFMEKLLGREINKCPHCENGYFLRNGLSPPIAAN